MKQFSTHESVSLEKSVELNTDLVQTDETELENVYEINKCSQWIKENNFKKVCLQFPDFLLPDSSEVALKLQEILGQTVYILGDTAYESCCIDYVAAAHINADAIIHYGPICFSKTSANIPSLNVYEKHNLNLDIFHKAVDNFTEEAVLLVDTPYIHHIKDISFNGKIKRIDEEFDVKNQDVIYLGENDRKVLNISLTSQSKTLNYYNPKTKKLTLYKTDSKILKRRYFLTEKIKDSKTVGIVIGTLAVKNYLKVIERMKKLLTLSNKKYYLISVGKPTVAKLANFPEMDVYVIITCAMNEIYESRDYYKPLVTPFDVEIALNSNAKDVNFSYDYNSFINASDLDNLKVDLNEDVSLLTGNLRSNRTDDEKLEENSAIVKKEGSVVEYGAGFLQNRTWRGLEQNLGQTEVKLAEEGRRGIAGGYNNEQV